MNPLDRAGWVRPTESRQQMAGAMAEAAGGLCGTCGYLSEPFEQPRRAHGSRAHCLDAGPQLPVGCDHGDFWPVSDPCAGRLHDRGVAGTWCMNRVHATCATGRYTLPRGTFENQDDVALRQFRRGQLLPQSPGCSSAVKPPAVRATAHDVGAVDDERLHVPQRKVRVLLGAPPRTAGRSAEGIPFRSRIGRGGAGASA